MKGLLLSRRRQGCARRFRHRRPRRRRQKYFFRGYARRWRSQRGRLLFGGFWLQWRRSGQTTGGFTLSCNSWRIIAAFRVGDEPATIARLIIVTLLIHSGDLRKFFAGPGVALATVLLKRVLRLLAGRRLFFFIIADKEIDRAIIPLHRIDGIRQLRARAKQRDGKSDGGKMPTNLQ